MRNDHWIVIAWIVSGGVLVSCKGQPAKMLVAPPDYGLLKPCKEDGHTGDPPSVIYQIIIPEHFDFRHPTVTKNTFPMVDGKPDALHPLPNPTVLNNPPTTRLDIATQMKTSKQTALIQIVLMDQSLDFQSGAAAVWDPKPKKNGFSNMFCGLDTSDPRSVTFTVHYPDDNGPNKVTHGYPNIGVVVKDDKEPKLYSLPIFLDPDVTNDG